MIEQIANFKYLINWLHLIDMNGYFELELLVLLDWNNQPMNRFNKLIKFLNMYVKTWTNMQISFLKKIAFEKERSRGKIQILDSF